MNLMKQCLAIIMKPRYNLFSMAIGITISMAVFGAGTFWLFLIMRAAVFESPLPDVRVADQGFVDDSTAYDHEYEFTENWFSSNIPVWEKVLAPYKGQPDIQYLEIEYVIHVIEWQFVRQDTYYCNKVLYFGFLFADQNKINIATVLYHDPQI